MMVAKPATEAPKPTPKPAEKAAPETYLAAVLIRGLVGVKHEIKVALFSLRMRNKHVCVILKDTPAVRGQLQKCKDYIAYGFITAETKKLLEEKRGVKDADGKLKPFFRLAPPKGGFESKGTKKSFREGGALGWRGKKMNELIARML